MCEKNILSVVTKLMPPDGKSLVQFRIDCQTQQNAMTARGSMCTDIVVFNGFFFFLAVHSEDHMLSGRREVKVEEVCGLLTTDFSISG